MLCCNLQDYFMKVQMTKVSEHCWLCTPMQLKREEFHLRGNKRCLRFACEMEKAENKYLPQTSQSVI